MSRKIIFGFTLVSALLSSCSMMLPRERVTPPPEAAPMVHEPVAIVPPPAPGEPNHLDSGEMKITLKKADGTEVPVKEVAAATPALSPAPEIPVTANAAGTGSKSTKALAMISGPVPAEKALMWLKHGNQRFVKGLFRKDGATSKDVARVASNQHPHSIILAGTDSRVPPEIIFDQKLGEVVVIRTLGPNLDHAVMASIEEAILRYGPHLIVVLGNTSSDTIKQAVATMSSGDAGSSSLNVINAAMHLRLASLGSKPVSKDYRAEAWANVAGVAAEMVQHSPIVGQAIDHGALEIHEAMYDTAKGTVEFK